MPDGIMQWFDQSAGSGAVRSGNRRYFVSSSDVESRARHGGARVHFDIARQDTRGRATNVVLRPGTRGGSHHHRFGSLQGARRPETGHASQLQHLHPEIGRSIARHPIELVRDWSDAVSRGDLEAARSYYAPTITCRLDGRQLEGQSEVASWLEATEVFSSGISATVRGSENGIVASWTLAEGAPPFELATRVANSQIVEQWHLQAAPPTAAFSLQPISVFISGAVDPQARHYAQRRLSELVELIEEPILYGRMTLAMHADPAYPRPAVVRVTLDVNGDLVRAHVAGHSMLEAIDLVDQRLRDRIKHRAEHRGALRRWTGVGATGEWRHGDLPTERPSYYDRPVEQRQLIRAKSFAESEMTTDEAIFDMELLGYDFYLFRELASDLDMLVERSDGSYRLRALGAGSFEPPSTTTYPVSVAQEPAPTLSTDEAIEALNEAGVAYLGFVNASSGRGNVCYRRLDGNYGLIALA